MQEFWTHVVNNPSLVGFKLGLSKKNNYFAN